MESDDAPVILPALEEYDVAAIEAILIRTVRAQDQRARAREEITAANERIASSSKIVDGAYQALKVFGFVEVPSENLWDQVREVIGQEKYGRAIAIGRGAQFPALLTKMGDDRPPSEAVSEGVGFGDSAEATVVKRSVPIRTAILEYLGTVGDQGAKVAQVKKHLADAYGITVHEKTPGMTLYRLLKEGLVTKNGRTWIAAASNGTKENKALSGALNDFDDLLGEPDEERQEEEEYEE